VKSAGICRLPSAALRVHEHDDNPPAAITPPRLSPIYSIIQWECSRSGPSLTPVFTLHNSCGAPCDGPPLSRPGFSSCVLYVCASARQLGPAGTAPWPVSVRWTCLLATGSCSSTGGPQLKQCPFVPGIPPADTGWGLCVLCRHRARAIHLSIHTNLHATRLLRERVRPGHAQHSQPAIEGSKASRSALQLMSACS
jgi:hypothetical protein